MMIIGPQNHMELGTLEALPITQFNSHDSCSEFSERF